MEKVYRLQHKSLYEADSLDRLDRDVPTLAVVPHARTNGTISILLLRMMYLSDDNIRSFDWFVNDIEISHRVSLLFVIILFHYTIRPGAVLQGVRRTR